MTSRFSTITIPDNVSIVLVDTRNVQEVLYLPVVSTNQGRLLFFKDYYGTSSNSTITFSTIGRDLIDDYNFRYTFSNSFGSMAFISDGGISWRTTNLYDGSLTPAAAVIGLTLNPALRYSFLSANYSGSGNVTNIGSNSAIGSGTVVRNSYTSASPGFITNVRAGQYVLGASVTNLRTIIMITRIRDTSSPSYFLDGRPGMGNGWIYDNVFGSDWNSSTYYRDCVSLSLQLPGGANDSQWHHNTLITASAYTSGITFANRFSQNEGMGCDIAEIMVFTQALTLQQVKDNFNFFASRFGWTPVA